MRAKRIAALIWKSSMLAIWYHGIAELHGGNNSVVERLSDKERVAHFTTARLDRSDSNPDNVFRRGLDKKH